MAAGHRRLCVWRVKQVLLRIFGLGLLFTAQGLLLAWMGYLEPQLCRITAFYRCDAGPLFHLLVGVKFGVYEYSHTPGQHPERAPRDLGLSFQA